MKDNQPCILCDSTDTHFYIRDLYRSYQKCSNCQLVFVPRRYWLTAEDEKSRYDRHENDPQDPGYRNFLSRMFEPLHQRIADESLGLDFGSGPGPTLSLMFEEVGHTVELYDPFYAPHPQVFERKYDFITATEVIEHLYHPLEELQKLWRCLRPGGYLGIMTQLVKDKRAFSTWHYKDDDTHVAFYSTATFKWLADQLGAQLEFLPDNVMLLQKPAADA